MSPRDATAALGSLAQEHRLAIFRLLVQAGNDGMAAGAIAEELGVPPSSLSFHLSHLARAGLVTQERQSRHLIYRADYAAMNRLMGYLTENCCGGEPCGEDTACPPGNPAASAKSTLMTDRPYTVLVLCTGNSARSILGEALFNQLGVGRIQAFSAGSQPKGEPHPGALRLLARKGVDTSVFRSKSWNEFTGPDATPIDLAITVCGNAAGETCPVFMGAPAKAHWGLPDPAAVEGSDAEVDAAFERTWRWLDLRIRTLLALDFETMDPAELQTQLATIGQMEGAA